MGEVQCNFTLMVDECYNSITRQRSGTSYVSDYYIKLKDLWDEFEALDPAPCDCEKSRDYVAVMKRQKLYQYLVVSNLALSIITFSQIILNSLEITLSIKEPIVTTVTTVRRRDTTRNCWKIIGYPQGVMSKKKGGAAAYNICIEDPNQTIYNQTSAQTGVQMQRQPSTSRDSSSRRQAVICTFTKEQYEQNLQMPNKSSMTAPSANMAHTTCTCCVFLVSNKPPEWIIDTRATNYMVSDLKLLSKSEEIKPSNPKKDLYSGRVKEIGKEYNGLYMLIPHTNKSNQETTIIVKDSTEPKEKYDIELWHKRLGHTQHSKCVNIIRTNNELELVNSTCSDLFSNLGMIHQRTYVYTPQQNGVAERKHGHILEDFVSLNAHEVVPYAIANYVSYSGLSRKYQAYLATFSSIVEPATYTEASQDPRRVDAMKAKIEALEAITPETLSLFLKERSQLVVNDYIKSNTRPQVKWRDSRLVAAQKWHIHQNVFLQGDLFDEIYMQFPPGFKSQGESQPVCRLHKFLYGLKQDPRQWNEKLREALYQFGFVESQYDHSLFIKQTTEGIMIVWYGILMHQRKYALEFISKLGLGEANPVATLLEVNAKLTTKEYDDHLGASSDVVDAKPVSTATKEVTYGGSNESC
ncbi:uncharacterized protein LOC142162014 [Nicotiana tabacum]|uniref:Uncharacterized protein LOC142162014 n=1 Tax=Nicotiana tabacum TaxID=4097 RepID=A0AC58RNV6_TOBAC